MRPITLTAALLLATTLTACGPFDDDPAPAKARTAVDKGGGPKAPDPAKPVVKTTVGTSKGTSELTVVSLGARGRLAHLTMSITAPTGPSGETLHTLNGGETPTVSLLDPVNLKRYIVVQDSAGKELGAGNPYISSGQTASLSYTFPAPPENVQTVDVQFGRLTTFRNVPIER